MIPITGETSCKVLNFLMFKFWRVYCVMLYMTQKSLKKIIKFAGITVKKEVPLFSITTKLAVFQAANFWIGRFSIKIGCVSWIEIWNLSVLNIEPRKSFSTAKLKIELQNKTILFRSFWENFFAFKSGRWLHSLRKTCWKGSFSLEHLVREI